MTPRIASYAVGRFVVTLIADADGVVREEWTPEPTFLGLSEIAALRAARESFARSLLDGENRAASDDPTTGKG